MRFPEHMTSIDQKLRKLASYPMFYQLYKRGDLIKRMERDPNNWHENFSLKDLYAVLAEERSIKIEKQLALLKNRIVTVNQANGNPINQIQKFILKQIQTRSNISIMGRLAEERTVLREYSRVLRKDDSHKRRKD